MSTVSFADVVHQYISFSVEEPAESLALKLCDTAWMQRLRDISQTANTRLVYMFSEHSRFGHSLGVAYLANMLMRKLAAECPEKVIPYQTAVSAAAVLHDIGHLAPGSHTAFKIWFPFAKDAHEELAVRIIENDPEIHAILQRHSSELPALTSAILKEEPQLPPWTWEIISGGGWNTDRGNWCVIDSILAGVSYGKYNIPALIDALIITPDSHLAIRENRLDAMMHFAVSRHAMYRQIYQHRTLLAADVLAAAIAKRARDLEDCVCFADEAMRQVLRAQDALLLPLNVIFEMRESWWRYHLFKWSQSQDKILADLAGRLLSRRLFKTVRIRPNDNEAELHRQADEAVRACGFDPSYYLHKVSAFDVHEGDAQQSMLVSGIDGDLASLSTAEPLYRELLSASSNFDRAWLVMPLEAKMRLGRER
jgi:HD superfamily phosphohydrolase